MEALADVLQPYKALVGNLAAIVTIGQMFSGVFICKDIYNQKNTNNIGIMPFVGGIVMSVLNLQYGFILGDPTMVQVNLFGLALNIIYVCVYFNYSQQKMKVWAQIGLTGAFSAAFIGYAQMEDPKLVENRFGLVITVLMFSLISAPLLDLKQIIAKRSTEGLPFPIILSGTVVTFMWLLYGIILKNSFLVVQNIVAFALCSFQLSLFVIYPSKGKAQKVKAKKTQ